MFTIAKRFAFSAAHQLDYLPKEHPCSRLHGHNYEVEFILAAHEVDPATGFVYDYRELDTIKTWIDTYLDHTNLNQSFAMTTAECLARELYARWQSALPQLVAVRVSETPKTWAEFRPTDVLREVRHAAREEARALMRERE